MIFHLYVMALAATFAFCQEEPIPNFFDARVKWPHCMYNDIQDQLGCNATWAHAIAGIMTNRYCIKTDKRVDMSPQDLLCQNEKKCNGEFNLNVTFEKVQTQGLLSTECWPYDGDAENCPAAECKDPEKEFKRYTCGIHKKRVGEESIKRGIMKGGPMMCVFRESIDHMEYYDGIYYEAHHKKRYPFQTAIKLLGWGIENGMGYWIGEISLGRGFGENGYIRYKIAGSLCQEAHYCDFE